MSAPRFSWGIDENSDCLRLQVDHGDRSVSWVLTSKSRQTLAKTFREVAFELHPIWLGTQPKSPIAPVRYTEGVVTPEPEQQSEESTKAQLDAKAARLKKPGGEWFANLDQGSDEELPLFTLGRGDPE